ncbi:RagB/SusD family nutrient uptake outer membrane protein [Maribacter sp. 2304DJ31-5]|uniref:RagB/SusD family nutrient uptake outer membrane protein n=1 Tax=Maribacter sp. 2304DJ31-5 TaxID=3386273 RepID=UPI0039BD2B6D
MKNIKQYIALLIITIIFNACDDFVDVDPRGVQVAETLDDVDLLLNATVELSDAASGFSNAIPAIINDNIVVDESTVNAFITQTTEESQYGQMYKLSEQFYINGKRDETWARSYAVIGSANHILSILEKIEPETEREISIKNRFTAEALTHRAFSYFWLVNIYGQHYGLTGASEANSGVPIISEFGDFDSPTPRATVNEVYDFILNDLTTALPLATTSIDFTHRVSRLGVQALLAKVYLHMGRYDEALTATEDALSLNDVLLDYNDETYCALDFDGNCELDFDGLPLQIQLPIEIENPEFALFKDGLPIVAFTNSFVFLTMASLSDDLLDLYDFDFDLRFRTFSEDYETGNTVFGNEENIFFLRSNDGVTVPELMLIQAECLARDNQYGTAIDIVNALRATRFATGSDYELFAADGDEALVHIKEERRREFHVNSKRFFEIKRYNAQDNDGIEITRGSVTLAPNSINWAMPIGQNVIDFSQGSVVQNPRE